MTPEALADTQRGSVVAAAGCGKTDLIARAVGCATGRQLVLTHTNAGVEALRRRLRRYGISLRRVSVDTIAGFCLKYVLAYPGRSGGVWATGEGLADWNAIYPAMAVLTNSQVVRKVLQASYEGVFVDEYQDCGAAQHELVCRLAEMLPMRILGDPLQAVFRFAGEPPPWLSSVEAAFPRVGTLTTPWRWRRTGENSALGDWLSTVRGALESMQPLDLSDGRIEFVATKGLGVWHSEAVATCFDRMGREGNSVAILKWPSEYMLLGQLTGGLYQCVEAIDAKDAAKWLDALESAEPGTRSACVLQFTRTVAAHVDAAIAPLMALRSGGAATADAAVATAGLLLDELDRGGSPSVAADALDAISQLPGLRVFRRELLGAVSDSLRDADTRGYVDLRGVLRCRRNLTSHVGRRLSRRTVGSTLLLKGMEFDHAIVVHTGKFSRSDLYVALTRASKSLTVLAPDSIVDPRLLSTS